jgi:hypothetical protein
MLSELDLYGLQVFFDAPSKQAVLKAGKSRSETSSLKSSRRRVLEYYGMVVGGGLLLFMLVVMTVMGFTAAAEHYYASKMRALRAMLGNGQFPFQHRKRGGARFATFFFTLKPDLPACFSP